MKIIFNINYKTNFGQSVMLTGNINKLGNNNLSKALKMYPRNGKNGDWDCIIELPDDNIAILEYKYFVENENNKKILEHGKYRVLKLNEFKGKTISINDAWRNNLTTKTYLESSAFTQILFKRTNNNNCLCNIEEDKKKQIIFRLNHVIISENQSIAIKLYSNTQTDNFEIRKACSNNFPIWEYILNTNEDKTKYFYKYCIVSNDTDDIISEEEKIREFQIINNTNIVVQNDNNYTKVSNWHGVGVAVPVFSLRTKTDFGIGEFTDLKLLVDWCVQAGINLIQILPINDTTSTFTWRDSYPYSAISAFALNPIYLNISNIIKDNDDKKQKEIEGVRIILNNKKTIDYQSVLENKFKICKAYYNKHKETLLKDEELKKFVVENKKWLLPYASFSYLRDTNRSADFHNWGKFSVGSASILSELNSAKNSHFYELSFYYYIQYLLHKQLSEAGEYASKHKIILKGDLPIGITKNSVDAWVSPELYNLQVQAGAPPDDFSIIGQNWGFPTYNWDKMKESNFEWWRNRMKQMAKYFSAYRIDHILGFFRIWEIPNDHIQGIMGYFNPSIPLTEDDFNNVNLDFEYERYCLPYITKEIILDKFGDLSAFITDNYLTEYSKNRYKLQHHVCTQAQIIKNIKTSNNKIISGLLELSTNVILLPYPYSSGKAYIPRHSMFKTSSFKNLSKFKQDKLLQLYNDYYFSKNEELWKNEAINKLPNLITSTNMLTCGEDLGMIPKCVPEVMQKLEILSLEIQRMPKALNQEFAKTSDYPYLSVASPSTHDTSNIRAWWNEDSGQTQRFYNNILQQTGKAPSDCNPDIVKQIIKQHINSKSMWAIFSIQDILGMSDKLRAINPNDERINEPDNPNNNWNYRLHINLDDLIENLNFNETIKKIFKR